MRRLSEKDEGSDRSTARNARAEVFSHPVYTTNTLTGGRTIIFLEDDPYIGRVPPGRGSNAEVDDEEYKYAGSGQHVYSLGDTYEKTMYSLDRK